MAVWVFRDSDSDSAGVVKLNILGSSLGDFCSARLLNSCCSAGAAQPPMVDSCGRTWRTAFNEWICVIAEVYYLFFFQTFSRSNPGGKLTVIECSAHLTDPKTTTGDEPGRKTEKKIKKSEGIESWGSWNIFLLQVLVHLFLFSQAFAFIPYKIREFSSSRHQSFRTKPRLVVRSHL